ncbi:MAG: S8 family serine peptidase [Sedimentisphaerales bacterium]|nr:S8 family serine peptidase [Sedimentisphaerales bacterium]
MKRQILIGVAALCLLAGAVYANQPAYRPGVALVRFADVNGQPPATAAKISIVNNTLKTTNAGICKEYSLVRGLTLVQLPATTPVENAVASLKQSSSVLYAVPDYICKSTAVPNDTRFSELWGMSKIEAPSAWDISTGSGNIVVAVTDTGTDYTHPDLTANMWNNPGEIAGNGIDDNGDGFIDDVYGYDFINNDGNPMDDEGHGTHVSGTIGAVGNNNLGVAGVCWNVKIMAVKCLDANGEGPTSAIINAVQYAQLKGARVINASLGMPLGVPLWALQPLYDAIVAARDAGIIFVAAAGNDYGNNNDATPAYPSSFDLDNIISVMATTDIDSRAGFSNYGLTTVDIGAPGQNILSTLPSGAYDYDGGTSMASPHVAGACALLLSIDPNLNYRAVKEILLATADPTLPAQCVSGGRLNLFAAALEAFTDTTPPMPPEWEMVPTATGPSSISMEAKLNYDRSGISYYFECTTNDQNSGWQANPLYSFIGLNANTTYSFRFKARDNSTNLNETDWSTILTATTGPGPDDTLPPAPNPTRWAIKPMIQRIGGGNNCNIRMKAKGVDQGGVEFEFQFALNIGPFQGPGWQTSDTFVRTGLTFNGDRYRFRCRARDKLTLLMTDWSTEESVVLTTGPRVLTVPIPYSTIQSAIFNAATGDIVEISPGTYFEGNLTFMGRAITVRSIDPENPDIVANTIINAQGNTLPTPPWWAARGFVFNSGEGPTSILAGLTIINGRATGQAWPPMPDEPLDAYDGNDGLAGAGGGILIGSDPDQGGTPSSPTIYKCIIRDCFAIGGNGQDAGDGNDGSAADPETQTEAKEPQNGGRGGNSGPALGGGIYVSPGSNPVIKDCRFISNYVRQGAVAGNGGDGGDGDEGQDGANGGNGGDITSIKGGGIYVEQASHATIIGCTFIGCNAFFDSNALRGQGGEGGDGTTPGDNGYEGFWGNGEGGGAFYSSPVNLNISTTNFTNNSATVFGGGLRQEFGTLTLTDCNFNGNISYYTGGGLDSSGSPFTKSYTTLYNSRFTSNNAGGGDGDGGGGGINIWFGNLTVEADTFVGNQATQGGAISCLDSTLDLLDCNITGNTARLNEGTLQGGVGGGIALRNTSGLIVNTSLKDNFANGDYGGGIFTEGWASSPLELTNCLITDNSASEEGGGLACKLGAWTQLTNCTVADNFTADFSTGAGGGISCKEGYAYVEVINSIVWGNYAAYGPQIAAGSPRGSDPYYPIAYVDVDYSDIEGGPWAIFTEEPEFLWWYSTSFDDDPLFISPYLDETAYYLSQTAAGQVENSPCLDAGNNTAVALGLDGLTTRTDQVGDVGIVDLGYHYAKAAEVSQYLLTIEVVDETGGQLIAQLGGSDPFIIEAPDSRFVSAGAVVSLQALADVGFKILNWSGTDNDASTDVNNTVTMNSDKVVRVAFHQFQLTIAVETSGGFPPDGNIIATGDGNDPFTITARAVPATRDVTPGMVVQLMAEADPNFRVMRWTGADDDASTEPNNTVTMDSDRTVIVAFEPDGKYYLDVIIIGDGTVTPSGRTLQFPGDRVTLVAVPNNSADLVIWEGTDNDYSEANRNTVRMDGHRQVTVTFYRPRILNVGASSAYPTIQAAIDQAQPRDIIQIMPSPQSYYTQAGFEIWGKDITITSVDPYDPAVVAATVIEQDSGQEATVGAALRFFQVGPLTRLQGITIRGFNAYGGDGIDGEPDDEDNPHYDGVSGGSYYAMGVQCQYGASPTIINCVIDDCYFEGGDGGNGADGSTEVNEATGVSEHPVGGNGGWPGFAYGGAVYISNTYYGWDFLSSPSNPTFINCTLSNNRAIGGDGGDGGNGGGEPVYGRGGKGGGWYYPESANVIWEPVSGYYDGYGRLPKDHSGLGGAVFIDRDSAPKFEKCSFINNRSNGGLNGITGQNGWLPNLRQEPTVNYRIDTLGGAIYMATGSSATFNNCVFADNVADPCKLPAVSDGFVSFGGALALEDGATAALRDCIFSRNLADVGGGVFSSRSDIEISDSNVSSNRAIHGGGLLVNGGWGEVNRNIFTGNDANAAGSVGGAIAIFGATVDIIDTVIADNNSLGHAGGIYASSRLVDGGEPDQNNSVFVKNCLITKNRGLLGGAGIAAVWHSDANIVNCTITGNSSPGGRGGGLYCAYGNYTNVLNSIIWGNSAIVGKEITVGIAENPSVVDVNHSDVNQIAGSISYDPGCVLNVDANVISANPRFVSADANNYHLSQVAAGQSITSPCVDAGADLVSKFGLSTYTTRTDNVKDSGIVDMGYHYPLVGGCLLFDYNGDGIVAFEDFAHFALSWLEMDEYDLDEFSDCWLFGERISIGEDTTPPEPDPMQWQVEPNIASLTSISMIAKLASDDSGGQIQYQFEETTGNPGGTDSDWQTNPMFTDIGLQAGYEYCYRVRARDDSNNATGWSNTVCVTGIGNADITPPTPPVIIILPDVNTLSTPDTNTSSVQFYWWFGNNWWHKVVVNVSGVVDDSGGPIEVRFVCTDDSSLNSDNKIPAAQRPILVGTPVSLSNVVYSEGDYTGWRLTYDGTNIVYDVYVNQSFGTGRELNWRVCVRDEAGNQACSQTHTIGPKGVPGL